MDIYMEHSSKLDDRIVKLLDNVEKVIIGKRDIIKLVVTALLADGHVLIEDVPGVGKTQLVEAVARSLGGSFRRLQMTPDVMPGDITGFSMVDKDTGELQFRKGAAFCHFLLADEINRASPKSQSALLEIMEENQVSVDGQTHELPQPFMVFATQNPVETYGTFHLPEAQMDRFIMKLSMGYPSKKDELQIIRRDRLALSRNLDAVISTKDVEDLRSQVENVTCSDSVSNYIIDIIGYSRQMEGVRLGISPRGTIAMYEACKAYAYVCGRTYVLPDDVKLLAPYVWGHRIILTSQGKARWKDSNAVIEEMLSKVKVTV